MPYHAIWPRLSAAWFQVNRQFHDLTRNYPALQHQRDLFSAGFTENRDCDPGDFVQRRKLCEERERKWSNSRRTAKMAHKLPEELISQWSYTTTLSRNLVISPSSWDNSTSLILLRIAPAGHGSKVDRVVQYPSIRRHHHGFCCIPAQQYPRCC